MTAFTERPTRGKDLPLKALEGALDEARAAVNAADGELRRHIRQVQEARKGVALARRNVRDIERSIEAVRALPTESLAEYQQAAKEVPTP